MRLKEITPGQRYLVPCRVLTRRVQSQISTRPLPTQACNEHTNFFEKPRSRKIRNTHDCIVIAVRVPLDDRPRSGVEIETELLMDRYCTCSGCGNQHWAMDKDGLVIRERMLHRQVVDPKDIISPLEDADAALRELLAGAP